MRKYYYDLFLHQMESLINLLLFVESSESWKPLQSTLYVFLGEVRCKQKITLARGKSGLGCGANLTPSFARPFLYFKVSKSLAGIKWVIIAFFGFARKCQGNLKGKVVPVFLEASIQSLLNLFFVYWKKNIALSWLKKISSKKVYFEIFLCWNISRMRPFFESEFLGWASSRNCLVLSAVPWGARGFFIYTCVRNHSTYMPGMTKPLIMWSSLLAFPKGIWFSLFFRKMKFRNYG